MKGSAIDQEECLTDAWIECPLEAIAQTTSGGTPDRKRADFYGGGIPWVKSGELNDSYIFQTEETLTSEGLKHSSAKLFPAGTLLMAMYGATVGKTAINKMDAATNQAVCAIFPNTKKADADFLRYFLIGERKELLKQRYGGAQPNISQNVIRNFPVRLPPLCEQRKIAEVLGIVQRAIEQQERLLQLTAELKKTLLHKLFTHGLRGEPQKQTEIGPVPESWEQRPLEQAGEVVYGIQAAVASNLKAVGTKILTNKNITLDGKIVVDAINYFVLKTKRHHEAMLKKGDLLFNWRSGSKEHVGKTAYFDLDGEFTHSSFILRIRPNDEVTGRYLFYYLNFLRESGYFVKAQTFSINAKFNKSAINRLPTYLPGEEERRDIVAALDSVTKKIAVAQTKNRMLDDLFRTLLHQLMTAQLRVHALDLSEISEDV